MMIPDEKAMIAFGRNLAQKLTLPATIELIGDLGAGKTTLVKGLAEALEVVESVTLREVGVKWSLFHEVIS